jgi:hypothetical protein
MSAADLWLISAMLAQGVLVLALLAYLGTIRVPLVMRGEVRMKAIALSRDGWPEREKKVSNAVDNQFQLPALFFAAALLGLHFGSTLVEAVLGWLFVILRAAHLSIHVTSNNVVRRFAAYALGYLVLCLLWLELIVRTLLIAFGGQG